MNGGNVLNVFNDNDSEKLSMWYAYYLITPDRTEQNFDENYTSRVTHRRHKRLTYV